MGAVTPILPVIAGIGSAVKLVDQAVGLFNDTTGRSAQQQLRQQQQEQQLSQQNALRNLAAQQKIQAEQSQQAENDRVQALRRAVARQRAAFGSQGVGSNGGSSQAVLLGLFDESDEERTNRERLDSLRAQSQDINFENQNATNLLLQTQLQEKQKLERFYLP